jgi:hypothetical protein
MDYRFAASEWKTLSVEERIRRCRLMADEALSVAATESPAFAEVYTKLSALWTVLAEQMEQTRANEGTEGTAG